MFVRVFIVWLTFLELFTYGNTYLDYENPAFECPNPLDIQPCTCQTLSIYSLHCHNVKDLSVLYAVFNATSGTGIESVKLSSSRLPYFPLDIIKDYSLRYLYFKDVILNELFDSAGNDTNNVSHLVFRNVAITNGWDWSSFRSFRRLDSLIIYNTSVGGRLTSSLSDQINPKIRRVRLIGTNLTEVEADAFANQQNITELTITRGEIAALPYGFLPNNLQHLHLQNNKIHSLADGIFNQTESLKDVDLRDNHISTLSESVFKPIWKSGMNLRLEGNPLKCDCGMKWITSLPRPVLLRGKCYHPKQMYGTFLGQLTTNQLNCGAP